MARRLSYRDLAHPDLQDTLKAHNYTTLKLVKTVAEFAQRVSAVHEQFSSQMQDVVDLFITKSRELVKESRPADCPNSLTAAWESLIQHTQHDAQSHADMATLLVNNVSTPLLEIGAYKRSQYKNLNTYRNKLQDSLTDSIDNANQCHKAYIEAYNNYRVNAGTKDAGKLLAEYHNAHNDYVLHIKSSNRLQEEYHESVLPYLLEELEEIHIDLANTLNGALESHTLLLLTKAGEQSRQLEGILQVCKQVNPKLDVHHYLLSLNTQITPITPSILTFTPPEDNATSETGTMKNEIIKEGMTEAVLKAKRLELQQEASSLMSFLKQNQEVTHKLMRTCQRNLASHQYGKVYETQEELCRKRNELRLANLRLSAIRLQVIMGANGGQADPGWRASKQRC